MSQPALDTDRRVFTGRSGIGRTVSGNHHRFVFIVERIAGIPPEFPEFSELSENYDRFTFERIMTGMQPLPVKRIIWDYDVDEDRLYAFITGETDRFHHFTREMIFVRILERLNWYEILDCLPVSVIERMLNPQTISMLRSRSMRKKYDYAARILHKQALPPTKWDPRNREASEYPILSNRWYSLK